jgi:hypothetical protein
VASGWPFLETKTRTQTNPPATSPANADFQIFAGAATPAGPARTRRHYGLPVIALAATGTGRTRSDPLSARPATWPARSTSSTLRDRAAEYRPTDGVARYHWPKRSWEHSLNKIKPESIQLQLGVP